MDREESVWREGTKGSVQNQERVRGNKETEKQKRERNERVNRTVVIGVCFIDYRHVLLHTFVLD